MPKRAQRKWRDSPVGDAAKKTSNKTADVAKATGSTTAKGAKATAGGAKKVGVGIKDAVTPDKKDDSKDKKK